MAVSLNGHKAHADHKLLRKGLRLMAQEQFAGPEYYTEFDPERFAKEFAAKMAAQSEGSSAAEAATSDSADTEAKEK